MCRVNKYTIIVEGSLIRVPRRTHHVLFPLSSHFTSLISSFFKYLESETILLLLNHQSNVLSFMNLIYLIIHFFHLTYHKSSFKPINGHINPQPGY